MLIDITKVTASYETFRYFFRQKFRII